MRTITARGFAACTTSQPRSNCSMHAGRVVLDHEVGLLDQAQRERPPLGPGEVQREVALVGVGRVEERGEFPPIVTIGADAAGVAHAVGPGDRLHVDDVGAERGEHGRRRRPRPPRGEVDDLDAVQRELGAVGRGRLRRTGDDGAGVLAEARRRSRRRRQLTVDPPRASGHAERAARVVEQRAAGVRLLEIGDRGTVRHRRHRDPQLGGQRHDLGGRVLGRPVVDDPVPLLPVLDPVGDRRPEPRLDEVGTLDHQQEAVELGPGVGVEADVAVGRSARSTGSRSSGPGSPGSGGRAASP